MMDKAVAVSVVAVTFIALIALWSPRLESAAVAGHRLGPRGPITIDAHGQCEAPPRAPKAPAARRGFLL
ncbi:MAG: hypothetical protein AAFX85_06950 [Pseudomonadota bacterium]